MKKTSTTRRRRMRWQKKTRHRHSDGDRRRQECPAAEIEPLECELEHGKMHSLCLRLQSLPSRSRRARLLTPLTTIAKRESIFLFAVYITSGRDDAFTSAADLSFGARAAAVAKPSRPAGRHLFKWRHAPVPFLLVWRFPLLRPVHVRYDSSRRLDVCRTEDRRRVSGASPCSTKIDRSCTSCRRARRPRLARARRDSARLVDDGR